MVGERVPGPGLNQRGDYFARRLETLGVPISVPLIEPLPAQHDPASQAPPGAFGLPKHVGYFSDQYDRITLVSSDRPVAGLMWVAISKGQRAQ